MDEAEVIRIMDAAIKRAVELDCGRPAPRLIQLCRVQSAAAARLEGMYRAGVITRYTMPSVTPDVGTGDGVTIRADFDYAEEHA
jgi:hypothetical protein